MASLRGPAHPALALSIPGATMRHVQPIARRCTNARRTGTAVSEAGPGGAPALPPESLPTHIRRTLRLALPVMVARAGLLVLIAVDTAMTGHAGALELAFYSLAMAPQVPVMLLCIGLLMGTLVLTAEAQGAGRPDQAGAVWQVSMAHAAVLGVACTGLFQAGEWFLLHVGQSAELSAGGGRVLVMLGWGFPAMLLYTSTTFFLEGIQRPKAGMVVMLLANLLNAALNWVFIYGNVGASAMGAEGAALATTLVRWFMAAAIMGYALTQIDLSHFRRLHALKRAMGLGPRLRRLGLPMGLGHGLETSAFAAMTLFAGWLGPNEVAAYQIAMNLVALAFMCAIGFSTAASIRVANANGRRDRLALARAGWVAVMLAAVTMGVIGVGFYGLAPQLASIYTGDPALIDLAAPVIALAALVLLPDGAQGVLVGALRGTADVWPAALRYLLSFWGLMVPLGYTLGVVQGLGAIGLMWAMIAGCVAAAAFLAQRFWLVSRRTLGAHV